MTDLLDHGKAVLAKQAFSQYMGACINTYQSGYAELSIELKDHHLQQHGFAHGGVVSYLADNCLTFAGASALGDSVTSEYKINYVRPAIGQRLVAKATVLSAGKSQAVCECKIFGINAGTEKLVAVAQGTIVKAQ